MKTQLLHPLLPALALGLGLAPLACSEEAEGGGAGGATTGGAATSSGGQSASGGASGGAPGSGGAPTNTGGAGAAPGGERRQLTLTLDTSASGANVPDDVTNYPLAVQLDAGNFDFSTASASGDDVRFEKPDGTPLPFELELWDPAAERAAFWVKMDQVRGATADQRLILVWGTPNSTPGSDGKAVFSTEDGFYGVWHLDQEGSTTPDGYPDSSGHEGHATGVNMIPGSRVDARVGKGAHLDNPTGQDTARWIRVTGEKAEAYNPDGPLTVSVWALAYSYPLRSYETILSKGDTSWSLQRVQYDQNGYQSCLLAGSSSTYHFCIYNFADQPLVTREWLHFMLVLDEPSMRLYINGRQNASGTGSSWNQGAHALGIGNQTQFDGRRQWDGVLDEPRVMRAARSLSWAKLDYESQRQDQTLITYGP